MYGTVGINVRVANRSAFQPSIRRVIKLLVPLLEIRIRI